MIIKAFNFYGYAYDANLANVDAYDPLTHVRDSGYVLQKAKALHGYGARHRDDENAYGP